MIHSSLARSGSSPNLKYHSGRQHSRRAREQQTQEHKHHYEHHQTDSEQEDEQEFYVIGDRVLVDGQHSASVAYFGELDFGRGDWVGVVLDEPSAGGHRGSVHGRQYFQCEPKRGLFVRPQRVSRLAGAPRQRPPQASASSSRSATPMPTIQRAPSVGRSSRASTIDSAYIYDEDYRQPTVASLARRLRSIEEPTSPAHSTRQTPVSILKRTGSPRSLSAAPPERQSAGRAQSQAAQRHRLHLDVDAASPPADQSAVFNFRPRRTPIEQHRLTEGDHMSTPTLTRLAGHQTRVALDLSSEPIAKGDPVEVRTERGTLRGILRYLGETEFATGEWAGVELDRREGKNDGCVLGVRYFHCPDGYGLFVPVSRLTKCAGQAKVFQTVRSTLTSPPPPPPQTRALSGLSGSLSNSSSPSYGRESGLSMSSGSYSPDYLRHRHSGSPASKFSGANKLQEDGRTRAEMWDKLDALLDDYARDYSPSPSQAHDSSRSPLRRSDSLAEALDRFSRPKFDDRDIDAQLRRTLMRPNRLSKVSSFEAEPARAKSVRYTFTSSKYNGNPVARRTLVYD